MRQALFAVVLVAASFAGGAVVNGPGLRWAQAMVWNRAGLGEQGTNPAAPTPGPDPAPEPGEKGPSHPAPSPTPTPPPPSPTPPAGAKPAVWQSGSPGKVPRQVSEKPSAPEPAEPVPPLLGQTPALEETPPPLDPPAPLATSREAAVETAGEKGKDAPVRLASMAADPPAAVVEPAPAGPADWAEVRRAMRSLGVSRYGVEGDPNGRARFHCLIPLAGRRAVGQHFEAEGDDELDAARSALRRVALWRATEAGGPTP